MGQDDLNDVRVRLNTMQRMLKKESVSPHVQQLANQAAQIQYQDDQYRNVVRFCQDSAVQETKKYQRSAFNLDNEAVAPKEQSDKRGYLWIDEFVRKSRI